MKLETGNLGRQELHELIATAIAPLPITFVSTVSPDGTYNAAPFSFATPVCSKPPIICVSIGQRRGQKKDTLRNIESTKEFVINMVDETLAEAMNVTAAPYPSDVDEFKEAGLIQVKADLVKVPMVAESPIKLECRLAQILELGEAPLTNRFIIGEVLRVHVRDELYVDGEMQMSELKAVGRLGGGGDQYCRTRDSFEMKRPTGGI